MKANASSGPFRPFENLKSLIDVHSLPLAPDPAAQAPPPIKNDPPDPEAEDRLFLEAVADVIPLKQNKQVEINADHPDRPRPRDDDADLEIMEKLRNLINCGEGFVVSQTAEYMEGGGGRLHSEITRRLHRGDYSVQAFIDLHGMDVTGACETFDRFMKTSVMTGRRNVLIVHGRGLSSPVKPVLKTKVYEWLTAGKWRKWVMAFSSARSCDGGAGATYVLLRRRPVSKRCLKRKGSALNVG